MGQMALTFFKIFLGSETLEPRRFTAGPCHFASRPPHFVQRNLRLPNHCILQHIARTETFQRIELPPFYDRGCASEK